MINSRKTILITGSSQGIGKAISKKFLKEEYQVIGIARRQVFKAKNYIAINSDIEDLKNYSITLDNIIKKYNNIITIVSSAGYGLFDNLENISENNIEDFFKVNLLSHIILAKKFVNYFKKKKSGNMIFMGSEAALSGNEKSTLYSSAKHGLIGFTESLRKECNSSNVRVSIINAGMVRTNFFDSLKFEPGDSNNNAILPCDIAELVFFLNNSSVNINYSDINLSPIKKVIKFKK